MESNNEQFGLRIRRKRTVLVYAAVCLLVLGIGVIMAVQWLTRPTEALMPTASSSQVKVDQANYRLYQSSSNAAPGAQLAADNTAATLPQAGASFRVRVGVENKEKFMSNNQISAGGLHTCAIAPDNNVYCWGGGSGGRLGNNSTTNSSVPVAVSTSGVLAGKTIKQISASSSHTCAIASDDKAYCWGYNNEAQLGNNSNINSSVPVRVYAPKKMATVLANAMKLRVQYVKKTAAACQAVATGWQDVTNNSALAYSASGPNNGTAIAAAANDPGLPSTSIGYSHQSIVRPGSAAQLTFTNNRDVNAGETGLWDLALTDNGLERNTNYCVRLAADTTAAPGTSIDTYSYYPEFKTADGSLDIRFADATDATLTNPTTVFSAAMTGKTASTTTAKLSNNSSQQLEVANSLSTTGWSVSLAATGGPTAKWTQTGGAANYAFNSTNADQGQLSVDLSSSAFTASGSTPLGQACTTAGLSYGAGGAFVAGTASANAITLATASSSSGLTCLFKLQDISLKQTIPAYQKPGTYTLPVTVTVVAQ